MGRDSYMYFRISWVRNSYKGVGKAVNGKITSQGPSPLCPVRVKDQRHSSPKSGRPRADSRKERFILETANPEAASTKMTLMLASRGSTALGSGFLKGQRSSDQEERTHFTRASEAPYYRTGGSALQKGGQQVQRHCQPHLQHACKMFHGAESERKY